jgi:hypothetical protein
MSMPGDGGFTVLMGNFINSLSDGEAGNEHRQKGVAPLDVSG